VLAHAAGEREREAQLGGCGVGGPGWPLGASFLQAAYAFSNAGEFASIWLSDGVRPLLFGSGQFVTPFARMHCANFTACV